MLTVSVRVILFAGMTIAPGVMGMTVVKSYLLPPLPLLLHLKVLLQQQEVSIVHMIMAGEKF